MVDGLLRLRLLLRNALMFERVRSQMRLFVRVCICATHPPSYFLREDGKGTQKPTNDDHRYPSKQSKLFHLSISITMALS